MKQAIAVLACAASLFAQALDLSIDAKISCRASFDEIKDSQRDAAADRIYASMEAKIRILEAIPDEKRKGDIYESELKSCDLSVDLLRVQLERVAINQSYVAAQKELSLLKDSLISSWVDDAKSLDASLASLNKESQRKLAEKDNLINKQKDEANKKLEALRSKTISVRREAGSTILSMNSDFLFETAKADLKPELRENLAEISGILKNLLADANVTIEGHTDNVGGIAANNALSKRRADAVRKYLVDRGVNPKRLRAVGYGQTKPVALNDTDEGKAKNRRVELVIKDR